MAFTGGALGGTQGSYERFIPAAPDDVYAALVEAAHAEFKRVQPNDFLRSVAYRSKASALTWGENYTAQVVPVEGGAAVRVSGASRASGLFETTGRMHMMAERLFGALVTRLR